MSRKGLLWATKGHKSAHISWKLVARESGPSEFPLWVGKDNVPLACQGEQGNDPVRRAIPLHHTTIPQLLQLGFRQAKDIFAGQKNGDLKVLEYLAMNCLARHLKEPLCQLMLLIMLTVSSSSTQVSDACTTLTQQKYITLSFNSPSSIPIFTLETVSSLSQALPTKTIWSPSSVDRATKATSIPHNTTRKFSC